MSIATFATQRMAHPFRRALRSDFMRHGALVFAASMAANILNYAFNSLLSRRLGIEGFATLSSLVSVLMILSIPANILTLVVVKYAATFHAVKDAQRIRRLSIVLLQCSSIAGFSALALGSIFRGEIGAFLRIPNDLSIVLTLGILGISFVSPSIRAILQGEEDFWRYSVSLVLEVFLKVALAVALVYTGMGVAGAMGGWLLGSSAALGYTVWAVMSKHGAAVGPAVRLSLDVRRLVRTTFGIALASGMLTCITFMDVLLVKHYFEPRQAGLYAAVNLTGKVVIFLVSFIPAVVLPKATARAERGEATLPLLMNAGLTTVAILACVLAAAALIPGTIIGVLAGHAFLAGSPYVLQYDAAIGMMAIVTLLVNFRIGIHDFRFLGGFAVVLLAEIVAIGLLHRTLWDVIHVLLVGNALAIAVCAFRLGRTA